jgi:hypothetical protein
MARPQFKEMMLDDNMILPYLEFDSVEYDSRSTKVTLTLNKDIPMCLKIPMLESKDIIIHWLSGIIDSMGKIDGDNVIISSRNKSFIKQVKMIFFSILIFPYEHTIDTDDIIHYIHTLQGAALEVCSHITYITIPLLQLTGFHCNIIM